MRMSMDVDVPLACKLDVVAGPGSGRGYTNTEEVLEVGADRALWSWVVMCCWWWCCAAAASGAGGGGVPFGYGLVCLGRGLLLLPSLADYFCLCASAAGTPHAPKCTLMPAVGLAAAAAADCDWAQSGGHDAAERWGDLGAARRGALEQRG
jgi:hypothetical protein